jgi:hypothetical protein
MVLVDASHPDQWVHIPTSNCDQTVATANRITSYLTWVGAVRRLNMTATVTDGLPARPAAEMKAILAQPRSWMASSAVFGVWEARTRPQSTTRGASALYRGISKGFGWLEILFVSKNTRNDAPESALHISEACNAQYLRYKTTWCDIPPVTNCVLSMVRCIIARCSATHDASPRSLKRTDAGRCLRCGRRTRATAAVHPATPWRRAGHHSPPARGSR